MSYKKLHLDVSEGIAVVTLDNPKVNALARSLLEEMHMVFDEIAERSDIRVVILTGAGKAFIAGADISELNSLDVPAAQAYSLYGQALLNKIENLPQPVIAAVNGYALGGGCEVALACTFRIASELAVFGQPEVKLGVIAGFGGTQRLPRLVGTGHALEILLTGNNVSAEEAYRIGLANRVVSAESLIDAAKEMASTILAQGPVAVSNTKEAVYRGLAVSLHDGLRMEADLFGLTFASEDASEGTRAFLEKRKPEFKGR
ncbi:MAG: enoyl-CoA hydratase-related protein [bacterium]